MSKKQTRKQSNNENMKKSGSHSSLKQPVDTDQSRRARQKEMVDALNRQNIHRYLKNIQPQKETSSFAVSAIQNSINLVQRHLKKGIIDIPNSPSPLPEQTKKAPKLNYEQLKQQEIKARREQIQKKIGYLQDQIRGQHGKNNDGLVVEFKDVLSKEEHQQKVRDIVAEKAERKRRLQELAEDQERKRKQQKEKEDELRALQKQKQLQQKRMTIENNLKRRKSEHEKFLSLQQELQKQFNSARNKQPLYQKMEQRYQSQVLLPSLQEKKNKLRQLRDFHKRYDLEAVRDHQKQYILRQQERSKEKQEKDLHKSQQYHPPPRSNRLNKLLEEQAVALKQKIQEKKIKNDQMQRRIQNFQKQVKIKHMPKVDQTKKQQIIQRYVEEQKKHQKLNIDSRKLGQNYMQIAKKMRRSESDKKEVRTEEEKDDGNDGRVSTGHPVLQLSRAFNRSQQFYENVRRKRMEGIMNSQQHSPNEKYHLLKLETEKIGEKIKRKEQLARVGGGDQAVQQEAAELLLSSIKAKMGIMNVLKKQRKGQTIDNQQ